MFTVEGFVVPPTPPAPLGHFTPSIAKDDAVGHFSREIVGNNNPPRASAAKQPTKSSCTKDWRFAKASFPLAAKEATTSPSPEESYEEQPSLPSPAGQSTGLLSQKESKDEKARSVGRKTARSSLRKTRKVKEASASPGVTQGETSHQARRTEEAPLPAEESNQDLKDIPYDGLEAREDSPNFADEPGPALRSNSGSETTQACAHPCKTCRQSKQRKGIKAIKETHMATYRDLGMTPEEAVQLFNAIKNNCVGQNFFGKLAEKGGDHFIEVMKERLEAMEKLRSLDAKRPTTCTHPCHDCETQTSRDVIKEMAEDFSLNKAVANEKWEAQMRDLIFVNFAVEVDFEAVEVEHGFEFAKVMRERVDGLEELRKGVARTFGL